MHTPPNGGHSQSMIGEVLGLSKNDLAKCRTLEHDSHPQHGTNNIRRKRHFVTSVLAFVAGSVSSVAERKTGVQRKESLHLQKPHKTTASNLTSVCCTC